MSLDLPPLRAGVRALRGPRSILLHDAHRWRLFSLPEATGAAERAHWLAAHGLAAGATVPKERPRISQLFWLERELVPAGPLVAWGGSRFSCAACGESCRGHRLGPILPADAARLRALDWAGTGRAPEHFFTDSASEIAADDAPPGGLFLRKEGEACQFLRADHLCEVHARFGAAAKPLMCRAFPFVLRATASGLVAGLRLGECLSAEEAARGAPLPAQEAELRALWEESPRVALVGPQVWLGPGALVSWEEYAALEEELLALAPPVRGAVALLLAALRAVEERAGLAPAAPRGEALREIERDALEAQGDPLPLFPLARSAPTEAALALDERIARQALFNKDAFQHGDVVSGVALLAVMAHLAGLLASRAAGGAAPDAAAQNRGWKAAAALGLRDTLARLSLPVRAVAASITARSRGAEEPS